MMRDGAHSSYATWRECRMALIEHDLLVLRQQDPGLFVDTPLGSCEVLHLPGHTVEDQLTECQHQGDRRLVCPRTPRVEQQKLGGQWAHEVEIARQKWQQLVVEWAEQQLLREELSDQPNWLAVVEPW